ncbi:MEDS domain-containing protein [Luteolibacter soli]|uniref:MEDS domain-containing protein n=1 Tax=Luteolibacter soli TaxID=3135280 RepID=A0ABU9ANS0_9BACT
MDTMHEVMENLRGGDHAALFYRTRAEQLAVVVPFVAIGLKRGERCLYIAEENCVATIIDELEKGGVDVAAAQKSGALTISTKHDTYLRHGIFEPAKMTADLMHEVTESIRLGYTAFRATGEMSWALTLPSALAELSDYETRLHAQFPGQFVGLCQYDERSFSPRVIADMIRIHPIVIARGKLMQNRFHQAGATVETLLPDLVTVDQVVDSNIDVPAALAS